MTAAALATLPGAPLTLPSLTGSVSHLPPELVQLREHVDAVVASLPEEPRVVITAAPTVAVWADGDLGLGGFGTGDPSRPWSGSELVEALARTLRVRPSLEELPTEARVVARLTGPDSVAAIVGIAPDDAKPTAVRILERVGVVVAVGDLTASVGAASPRPPSPEVTEESGLLDAIVQDGHLDRDSLESWLSTADPSLATALQVILADSSTALAGAIHVVRGVASLVAGGSHGNR